MLSDETRTTPRPQPPAKVRARKSSQASTKVSPRGKASSGSPPPPYYSTSEPVLGSPLPVTSQLLESNNGGNVGDGPGPETWLLEKSREELSGLLSKAEGIIKSREERFGVTSQLVKSLHVDNQALKTKYESLVQRIPGASPIASPLGSPRSSFALSRPSSDGNSDSAYLRPLSPIISSSMLSASSVGRRKGSKRISMTPVELGQLADQNAQLTSQLEDLEREATKADESAKRKLGKLEREIERLKGDLDKALEQLQQKEKEIERSSEAKRQRLERDERLLALREKQQQQHPEVVDFSPPSIPVKRFTRFEADDSRDERVSFPSGSQGSEVDLISQLMHKIRELEETNQEINDQQNESDKKLKKAMIGAEGMRKVYDYLSDDEDVEVEIVDEDEFLDANDNPFGGSLESVPEEELPIRFSSLRRTINEDIHKRLATELFEGDDDTYDELEHGQSRSRGTIVGLFDSLEMRGRTLSLMDLQDEDSDDMDDSKIFSRGVSPIGSPLLMPQDPPAHIRSLGSELGSEYGDDMDGSASEHRHVRTTSLLSLTALMTDNTPSARMSHSRSASRIDSSPTPTPTHLTAPSHQRSSSMRDKHRSSDTGTFDRNKSQLRSRLLSQTISARSTRWSDGRLEDVAISASRPRRVSAPLVSEMFQNAVQQITGSPSVTIITPSQSSHVVEVNLDEPEEAPPEHPEEEEEEIAEVDVKESKKRRTGLVGCMLELWLWLQFALIILVFVWAMARRGPRNVLKEADRKRA
ncbi:hypothetical protein BJ322DRAFT_168297 [Thelephora terrestris]|uniref:Uncharacterized protein n=1 Tax=Thelephora terrestris TaxID=56493 RepID=A0A9P6HA75_9AGAM|nr:hypothetical protein BJ322DRAFT_168297 [Thelephora terrestris]